MPIDNPPPPPVKVEQESKAPAAPIADMRDAFARKTQTQPGRVDAKAFIDGKIEMIRRDPHMTEAQKAAAIADLKSRRDAEETEPREKPPK